MSMGKHKSKLFVWTHRLGAVAADRTARLSPREHEVLALIATGHSTKETAHRLHISVKTAETHRANLMRKLDLHSVSDLVHYAIRNKIVAA
jgi:DNA-binding CsgD family transcriptional regulator